MSKLSDEWQTPQDLFDILNNGGIYQEMNFEGFNFDIDLCATRENSKCKIYYEDYLKDLCVCSSIADPLVPKVTLKRYRPMVYWGKYLDDPWKPRVCFLNPPYSNPKPFIEKAWKDSKHCKIVCLVKCDPSTKWWSTFWDYSFKPNTDHQVGPKPGCWVRFFPKRIKFDPPQELIGIKEVYKIRNNWVSKCYRCKGLGYEKGIEDYLDEFCISCDRRGYHPLSGPTFPCALLIFDRRYL